MAGLALDFGRLGGVRIGNPGGRLGYDAVSRQGGRSRRAKGSVRTEDDELSGKKRRQLVASVHDLSRNYTTAAWMIRFHCAAVAQHTFQADTGDKERDRDIEALIAEAGRKGNFDVTGRYSAETAYVLAEMTALADGDTLVYHLPDGRTQFFEGDRIGDPPEDERADGETWVQGVRLGDSMQATGYAINNRKGSSLEYVETLEAGDCHLHGFFGRFDQVRGITPLSSAINPAGDLYEAREYALNKAKIAQLLGLKITRKSGDRALDPYARRSGTGGGAEGEEEEEAQAPRKAEFKGGFQMFDLDDDEDAAFMNVGDVPGNSFMDFARVTTQEVLRALDLDMAFYDSAHTNWSGHHMAKSHWKRTARLRQAANAEMRSAWSDRVLALPANRKALRLQQGEPVKTKWLPHGLAGWTDPRKEVAANGDAVDRGFTSEIRVCAEQGIDYADVVEEKRKAREMREEAGELGAVVQGSIDAAIAAAVQTAVAAALEVQATADEGSA